MVILILLLLIAVIVDIRSFRIPNLCIIAGMAAGIVYSGWQGIVPSLLQLVVLFIVMYPFYLLGGIGAGDIKLWMMTGFYLKGASWCYSILISLLLAGIVAFIKLLRYADNRERLRYAFRYVRKACLTGVIDDYAPGEKKGRSVVRLSIPILCSVLLYYGGLYG